MFRTVRVFVYYYADMAKLTTKQRNALPDSAFAGPHRSYPVNDASHARAAKSRASEMAGKGKLPMKTKEKIDSKADRELTHRPEAEPRGKHGRGHEQPGLGTHGEHRNVVNAHSMADKLRHC